METRSQRVTREDVLMFVNACFACTGQKEFYSDGHGQSVSIGFLHSYMLGNYRRMYARILACGVNHFNQALIVGNLLASGRDTPRAHREEENALVTRAVRLLPTHRAMHLLADLKRRRVNNRRARALTRAFLLAEPSRDFRAVKYRESFRAAALHAHVPFVGELAPFFLRGFRERKFETPLFESFRQAHYAEKAIYDLPFTIAEGLAAKHKVPRERFLERIAPRLTQGERFRLQAASHDALGESFEVELDRMPITRLASYVLSLPLAERRQRASELDAALDDAARRSARRSGVRFGHVACVLDRSYSSAGSREKRKRPLAVALAAARVLRATSERLSTFWTADTPVEIEVQPRGATDLATPILAALRTEPEMLVIVSDGYDNDPPGLAGEVLEVARRLRPNCFVIHVNPVYDTESLAPRSLSPRVPTMGIRDGDDIPTLVAFARFALGQAPLAELEEHLALRVRTFLGTPS